MKLLLALVGAAILAPLPAEACSVSRTLAGTAEERVAGRTDLRPVKGTLRLDSIQWHNSHYDGKPSRVFGRVTTQRRTWLVVYSFDQLWVDCLIYYLPTHDASGTFYVSRRKRDGYYELVDWSGEYIEGNGIPDPEEVTE